MCVLGRKRVQTAWAFEPHATELVDPSVGNIQPARHDVKASLQCLTVHVADPSTDSADQKQERQEGVAGFHVISSAQHTCWSAVMPRQSGDGWFLKYESAKASTRLLLSLPKPMLDDVHAVAKAQGISVAELARRAMTHHMAELVKANPSLVALRGSRQGP